jgi:anaphase-promoting complex subunit 4
MDMNAFASLAVLQLPSVSSLLPSACCPDKDLVVLISRRNRLGLWKVQGSKKWEVDIASSERNTEDIVGLAWSPDGNRPKNIVSRF